MADDPTFDISTRMDWVASYPKSGNTWCRLLISAVYAQTVCRVEYGMDLGPYFFGAVSPVPIEHLTMGQQMQLRPAALYHMAMRTRLGPTVVKTHMCNGLFFQIPMFSEQWVRKVVVTVRDPRDVLTSFAEHTDQGLETMAEQMGAEEATQTDPERGMTYLSSWSRHVASWLDDDRFDVLVVPFEGLKEDTFGWARKMVDHLGYAEVTDEQVKKAVAATDFDVLSKAEARAKRLGAGFPERAREDQTFFRKGEAGGWREEVPPRLVAKIEDDHGEMMERLGYELTTSDATDVTDATLVLEGEGGLHEKLKSDG